MFKCQFLVALLVCTLTRTVFILLFVTAAAFSLESM